MQSASVCVGYIIYCGKSLQLAQDPDVERVEIDQPVCDDAINDSQPVGISSFNPNELTWNIDRLDERQLPLDGEYCPAATGMHI